MGRIERGGRERHHEEGEDPASCQGLPRQGEELLQDCHKPRGEGLAVPVPRPESEEEGREEALDTADQRRDEAARGSYGPRRTPPFSVRILTDSFSAFFPRQVIYSQFMHTLAKDNIRLDRKTLSDLAINEPHSFKALVDRVKFMRGNL